MSSSPSRRARRTVLSLAAAVVASVLPVLPATSAVATPARPAAVLLAAPVVTPSPLPAGTPATITGTKCVPTASTRVYVTLSGPDGGYLTSTSVVPAADGTWTAHVTPSITSPAGSYSVAATCDGYNTQAFYRSRTVPVTAASTAPWTAQAPKLPAVPNGSLVDVDCVGAAFCVAVGSDTGAGGTAPLVETWNGSTWAVTPVATPAGASGDVYLGAVDCPTTTRCVAVGDITTPKGHETYTAVLAGTTWTASVLDPPPGEHEATLSGVSCPTTKTCFAVGSTGALSEGSVYRPIAYRLLGATWSQLPNPQSAHPRTQLSALSCADATTCVAIGSIDYGSSPIAEVFDGTVWRLMSLAALPSDDSPRLSGIACPTTSTCAAVGSVYDVTTGGAGPLVEVLTDTTWRLATVAGGPTVGGSLQGISCTASKQCTAVGGNQSGTTGRPVVVTGRNGSWSATTADVPAGATNSRFSGVTCTTATSCLAVGSTAGAPLAATGSGAAWTDVHAVAPAGFLGGEFDAVACSAVDACTAGGWVYRPDRTATGPLVNRWNGTTWTRQSVPSFADARIAGVACPATDVCFAVGSVGDSGPNPKPLLLEWRGGAWTRAAFTLPSGRTGVLAAVSCSSTTSCLAVGRSGGLDSVALAVALTGTTWKLTSPPPVGGLESPRLTGVSCLPAAGCRVVGSGYDDATFEPRGIDLLWKTTGFSVGPQVQASGAVSCAGPHACVAVGQSNSGQTSASVFTGTAWTAESLPDPTGFAQVNGVACRGTLACVAVGGADGAFVVRRTGTGTWAAEPVATSGSTTLEAVTCPADGRCVAVGQVSGNPAIVVSPRG